MRSTADMTPTLPENEIATPCQPRGQAVVKAIARFESLKRKRAEQHKEPLTGELDEIAAPWFEAAVSAYGKADALAEELGVDKSYLSRMRAGKVPVALRHLIPIAKSPAALEAFMVALAQESDALEVVHRRRLTKEELCAELLRFMLESGPLLKLFAAEVARRRGVESDDVMRALEE